jgi:hypothetical protein
MKAGRFSAIGLGLYGLRLASGCTTSLIFSYRQAALQRQTSGRRSDATPPVPGFAC